MKAAPCTRGKYHRVTGRPTSFAWRQCVADDEDSCNVQAHGGQVMVYTCRCGAQKFEAFNGAYIEKSSWRALDVTTPGIGAERPIDREPFKLVLRPDRSVKGSPYFLGGWSVYVPSASISDFIRCGLCLERVTAGFVRLRVTQSSGIPIGVCASHVEVAQ